MINTYSGARSVADEAVNNVTGTAGSAIGHVATTTESVINSAKSTAGSTVDNVMVRVTALIRLSVGSSSEAEYHPQAWGEVDIVALLSALESASRARAIDVH